jgi:hypothetical protein
LAPFAIALLGMSFLSVASASGEFVAREIHGSAEPWALAWGSAEATMAIPSTADTIIRTDMVSMPSMGLGPVYWQLLFGTATVPDRLWLAAAGGPSLRLNTAQWLRY